MVYENDADLRKAIQSVQSLEISQKEKDAKVFAIMNISNTQQISLIGMNVSENCDHYDRGCYIVAQCCQKVFPCRVCHDDVCDHKIDRFAICEIVCKTCHKKQSCSNKCNECGISFAKYYCNICHLWLDNEKNPTYHCIDCGICRKGNSEDFFHCKVCNMCLHVDIKKSHKCVENAGNSNCPCCNDDLFNSTTAINVLKCGHVIHKECLVSYVKYSYECPICRVSIFDMTERWKLMDTYLETIEMPDEYKDQTSNILCNDCHDKSTVPFHLISHKCPDCHGYNTSII